MSHLEKYLVIKKSLIPKSGKGLFTKINIPKKTIIVEYKGKLQPWKDVKDEDGYNGYIFQISNRWAVNALHNKKDFGRYANDARGFSRAPGQRNNAQYIVIGRKVYIAATRKIHAGCEIFVDYGRGYWRLLEKLGLRK